MSKEFQPQFTPIEMLEAGVFGGAYWRDARDDDFEGMTSEITSLARDNVGPFRKANNQYGAKAGMSYQQWMDRGWIFPEDPLGWFHWYCRYWSGRRHERDEHQIYRWWNYDHRWHRMANSMRAVHGDVSNVVRQGAFQWAYRPSYVLDRI